MRLLYLDDRTNEIEAAVFRIEKELHATVTIASTLRQARRYLSSRDYDGVVVDVLLNVNEIPSYANSGLILLDELLQGHFTQAGNDPRTKYLVSTAVIDMPIETSDGQTRTVRDVLMDMMVPPDQIIAKPFGATRNNIVDAIRNLFMLN